MKTDSLRRAARVIRSASRRTADDGLFEARGERAAWKKLQADVDELGGSMVDLRVIQSHLEDLIEEVRRADDASDVGGMIKALDALNLAISLNGKRLSAIFEDNSIVLKDAQFLRTRIRLLKEALDRPTGAPPSSR